MTHGESFLEMSHYATSFIGALTIEILVLRLSQYRFEQICKVLVFYFVKISRSPPAIIGQP